MCAPALGEQKKNKGHVGFYNCLVNLPCYAFGASLFINIKIVWDMIHTQIDQSLSSAKMSPPENYNHTWVKG